MNEALTAYFTNVTTVGTFNLVVGFGVFYILVYAGYSFFE